MLFIVCGGCAITPYAGGKEGRKIPTYDARTFFETTSVFGASFSPDESRLLVTSDASGVFNAYIQPIKGGKPTMLTDSTTNSARSAPTSTTGT